MPRLPRLLRDTVLTQRRVLEALRDEGITDEAFAAYLSDAREQSVSRPLVTLWGARDNPRWMRVADLVGALRFSGRPERVLRPLAELAGCVLVPVAEAGPEAPTLRTALALGALTGRLQQEIHDAQDPDGDGGVEETPAERERIVALLDEVLRQVTAMRASYAAEAIRPRVVG